MTAATADGSTVTAPVQVTSDGSHDAFKHYVPRRELTDALVFGREVVALCGKRWVPARDPDPLPWCPPCKTAWAALPERQP